MPTNTTQFIFIKHGNTTDEAIDYVNSTDTTVTDWATGGPSGTNTGLTAPIDIKADLPGGFYYIIDPEFTSGTADGQIRLGFTATPTVAPTTVYSVPDPAPPNAFGEAHALEIDTTNHILYLAQTVYSGSLTSLDSRTGIVSFSYNPTTGALTGPNNILTRGAVGSQQTDSTLVEIRGTSLDTTHHVLYFTDDSFGKGSVVGVTPTNVLKAYDTVTHAETTVVAFPSGSDNNVEYPTPYTNGTLYAVAADPTDNLVFFSTASGFGGAEAQNKIYVITPAGTGQLQLTEAAAFDSLAPFNLTFDDVHNQLYVSYEPTGNVNHLGALVRYDVNIPTPGSTAGITLINPVSFDLSVDNSPVTSGTYPYEGFLDQLPVLTVTGTSTHAPEQGANPAGFIDLTSAATTIADADNDHLASAFVKITGGTFTTATANESSANDDHLTVNDGGTFKTSGTFTGTNITISYDSANEKLTLTGYDTLANYQTVLNAITFNSTGDNPTDYGLHNTRTVTWHVSDGALDDPSGTNTTTTTLTIDAQNDGPDIQVNGGNSASMALTETNSAFNTSRTLTVIDPDSQTETFTLNTFQKTGFVNGISDATLQGYFSVPSTQSIVQTTGSLTLSWTFNSGSEAFNFLSLGETLTLQYTIHDVDSNDSNGPGSQSLSDDQIIQVVITGTNDGPTLQAPTAPTYTDTTNDDTFSNATGTLVGADVDHLDTLTYGISGGTTGGSTVIGGITYDVSKVGTFGTLYVKSTTGDYVYVPSDAAIEAAKTTTSDNFTVAVTDNHSAQATQPFNVTINGVNDTPTLAAPTAPTYTDTSADDTFANSTGTLVGADRDNDTLTYGITGGTTGGNTNVGGIVYDVSKVGTYGTLYVKSTTGQYVYVPVDSAIEALKTSTTDNFTVTTSDGSLSASQPFNVTLNGTNDTPDLAAPSVPTYNDTAGDDTFTNFTGTLVGTDRDNDTLTYGITGGTTGGSDVIGGITYDVSKVGTYGTLYVKSTTGQYVYVPVDSAIEALKTSTTDDFTVTTSDGSLGASRPFSVTLNGTNDTPVLVAVAGPTYTDTANDDTFSNTTGTLSASDRDNDPLTYGISGGTTGGSTVIGGVTYDVSKVGTYGTLYVKSTTGDYVYVPSDAAIEAAKTAGNTDSFTFTANDGTVNGTTPFTVTINGVNDTPTLAAPTAPTYTDTSADDTFANSTGTLVGADRDNDTLTYGITGGTTGGSTNVGGIVYDVSKVGTYGTLYVKSTTGQYVYVPVDSAIEALKTSTTDNFTVTTSDGSLGASQPFNVTLNGTNDTPDLAAPSVPTYNDTAGDDTFTNFTGTLVGTDRDNDTLTYGITGGTTGGSDVIGGITYDVSKVGTYGTLYVKSTTGQYVYVPVDSAIEALKTSTTDDFTVTTSDGSLGASRPFSVTLNGTNDTPVLVAVAGPTYTDTANDDTFSNTTGTLSASDRDNDPLTYGISGGTTGGSTVIGGITYDVSKVGTFGTLYVKSTTGDYVYVPSDAAIEAAKTAGNTDSFTFTANDGTVNGTTPFTVTINGVNDTPTLAAPTAPTYTDTSADDTFANSTGTLVGADRDNDTLTYGITGGTTGGSTNVGGIVYDVSKVGTYGTLYVKSTTGQYVYVPVDSAIEALKTSTTDNFTVTTSDGSLGASQPFNVTLNGTNDTPDLAAPSVPTYNDTAGDDTFTNFTGTLVGTDRDNDTLTYGITGGTTGGSDVIGGITYDVSKVGTYGTLYVKSTTGQYVYVPSDAAIEALKTSTTDDFTVTANDGSATGTRPFSVTLNGVDDTPVVDLNGAAPGSGATLAYTENAPATAIAPAGVTTDVDSADFNGGSLTVHFSANGATEDQLSILTDGTVTVSSGTVSVGGSAVGTVSGGTNGSDLVISFNTANATPGAVSTLIQHIGYADNSDHPSTAARSVLFTVDDGDGASGSATATINLTVTNDAPDLTPDSPAAVSYTENASSTQLLATGAVADPDAPANFAGGGLDLQITGGLSSGDAIVLLGSSGFTISAGSLIFGGNTIGAISGNDSSHVQVTGLTAFATPSVVNSLVKAFGFHSTSEDPGGGDRTVKVTFDDGGNTGGAALTDFVTQTVQVTPVNDAPSLSNIAATADYTENAAPVFLSPAVSPSLISVTISDPDPVPHGAPGGNGLMLGATVAITNFVAGDELLVYDVTTGLSSTSGFYSGLAIGWNYDSSTGILTLSGSDTIIDYDVVLSHIQFDSTSDDPTNGGANPTRTITWQVQDAGGTANGGQDTSVIGANQTTTLTVHPVNDGPVATITPASYGATEQTALSLKNNGLAVSDIDGNTGSETVTLSVGEGVLNVTAGGSGAGVAGSGTGSVTLTGSAAQINALLNSDGTSTVSYIDNTDTPGASTTLTLLIHDNGHTGGGDLSSSDSATINITAVNDAPVFANLGGPHPGFTENGAGVVLDNNVTVSDPELNAAGNYGGAILTLARHGGANPDDTFAGTGSLDLTDVGATGNVSLDNGATFIGTATQPGDGTFSITFNAGATAANVASVMQQIIYANASDNPDNPTIQIDWSFSDGNTGAQGSGGAGIATGSVTVDVTPVDDAPVLLNVAPGAAYTIGTSGVVLSPALGVFDVDATAPSPLQGLASATIKIESGFFVGDELFVKLPSSGGHFITPDGDTSNISIQSNVLGTLILSGNDTVSHYQSVLDAVSYHSTAADPTNGGVDASRHISWQVNDGALNSQTPDPDPNHFVNETVLHFDVAPAVDLDASGAGTGFTTTFTENGAPLAIVDTDVSITDPDNANLDAATIVLTNAKATDALSIAGTLPGGIESSIDTSVPGRITLHLLNSASLADYQTALGQIRFVNTSDTPNTTDRDITVTVTNSADSNVAHATIHVISVNDAPVAANSSASGNEDTSISGVVSATDVDNTPAQLSYSLVGTNGGAAHGTVVFHADGSYTYTPVHDFNGSDSFSFKANDGSLDSNVATVSLTVNPVNDAPVAANGSASGNEDTPISGAVSASDVDNTPAQLSYALVGANGGAAHGTVALNANGTFTYTPAANFNGSDSFSFKANDGSLDSNVATESLTINAVNDAPVAANGTASGNEDTVIAGAVFASDVDNTPAQLSYALVGANGGAAHGTVALNADGTFTYTPVANFNGSDSFSFKANDGSLDSNVATVSLTVNPVNDAPVAANGSASGNEDTPISGAVSASDVDNTPAQLSYALVGANGGAAHGTVALNANGTFTYTPAANFNGSDSFSFKANDGSLDSNVATESLTINAVNDAPVAANSSASGSEDTSISGVVSATDVDNTPAQLSYSLVGSNGGAAHGTVVFHADGSYTYTPVANFNGSDSFSFKANDGSLDSNVATVSLTVTPVNDAPVAANGSASGNEDTTINGTLSVTDVDNTPAQLSYSLVGANGGAAHGTVALNANGTFTYTPAANFNGSDSFSFKANDGSLDSNVATESLTINAVNDAPIAANSSASGSEDTSISGVVSATDVDNTPAQLSYSLVGSNGGAAHGTVVFHADGSYTYTPVANFNGSDSFSFRANDGSLDSNVATVSLTVTPVNDAPVAANGSASGNEDTTINGTLSVTDVDNTPAQLSYSLVGANGGAAHGTVVLHADGSFAYTPASNFNGSDTFSFKANDGALDSNVATESLTINAVNDAPVNTVSGALSVDNGLDLAITGLAVSDVDAVSLTTSLHVDHGTLKVAAIGGATVVGSGTGTVTLSGSVAQIDAALAAANNVLYHGSFDFSGTDHLTMTTNDGGGTGSGGPQTDIDVVDIVVGTSLAPPHLPFSGSGTSGTGSVTGFGSAFAGVAGDSAGDGFTFTPAFTPSTADTGHVAATSFNSVLSGLAGAGDGFPLMAGLTPSVTDTGHIADVGFSSVPSSLAGAGDVLPLMTGFTPSITDPSHVAAASFAPPHLASLDFHLT